MSQRHVLNRVSAGMVALHDTGRAACDLKTSALLTSEAFRDGNFRRKQLASVRSRKKSPSKSSTWQPLSQLQVPSEEAIRTAEFLVASSLRHGAQPAVTAEILAKMHGDGVLIEKNLDRAIDAFLRAKKGSQPMLKSVAAILAHTDFSDKFTDGEAEMARETLRPYLPHLRLDRVLELRQRGGIATGDAHFASCVKVGEEFAFSLKPQDAFEAMTSLPEQKRVRVTNLPWSVPLPEILSFLTHVFPSIQAAVFVGDSRSRHARKLNRWLKSQVTSQARRDVSIPLLLLHAQLTLAMQTARLSKDNKWPGFDPDSCMAEGELFMHVRKLLPMRDQQAIVTGLRQYFSEPDETDSDENGTDDESHEDDSLDEIEEHSEEFEYTRVLMLSERQSHVSRSARVRERFQSQAYVDLYLDNDAEIEKASRRSMRALGIAFKATKLRVRKGEQTDTFVPTTYGSSSDVDLQQDEFLASVHETLRQSSMRVHNAQSSLSQMDAQLRERMEELMQLQLEQQDSHDVAEQEVHEEVTFSEDDVFDLFNTLGLDDDDEDENDDDDNIDNDSDADTDARTPE